MKWYRSLYWRIALGVVAFLAAMLVVQAVFFVWAVAQTGRSLPGGSPARLGMTVALDLAQAVDRDPQLDLTKYVRDQYAQYDHPFFVMMADGRFITSGSGSFPQPLIDMAKARLQRGLDRPPMARGPGDPRDRPEGPRLGEPPGRDGPWREGGRGRGGLRRDTDGPDDLRGDAPRPRGPRPPPPWWDQPDRFADRFELDPSGVRFVRPSPIIVDGRLVGLVVVPPQAPFGYLLTRFAPILTVVAGAVLIVGTVLTSVLIFGPARRRLRMLETAARRFGSGDLTARAPERGGDEIAAVASAFNTMADDLAARAEALALSDRTRRQLLADVSHELTTPVTAMRGYLETLTMPELALDESTKARYLTIVGDETARLERLIGDLLDLARLEGGGGALRIDEVSVAQLFDRVFARHEQACANANVTMHASIAPEAERLMADADRLEQALQNLAANALRYAPAGTTIRLGARADGDAVALTVEDEGAGIPPEHLEHVFDRFYKADASRPYDRTPASTAPANGGTATGGSGLGLSIVKAIVERHGGQITVASRPGRTVFQMTGLRRGSR